METVKDTELLIVPAGKVRCFIHDGTLRQDTPEEHVRQRIARSLVEEYGYSKKDLHLEFPVKMGVKRKKADIAIFPDGQAHKQEHIAIIVEAKREDIKPGDRKEGVEQLKSYMAASLNCRWGLWVGAEMIALEKATDPAVARDTPFLPATDIPFHGSNEPKRLYFADLLPASEGLSSVFARCHNYIHTNGELGKEQAFFELLKLIFCKIHDERVSAGELKFYVSTEERRSELAQRKLKERISGLFAAVRTEYPYIFTNKNEEIELDLRSLAYCVSELQKYSLQQTAFDVKGEAYEAVVGVTSRRDQGAFFTPRNVCDMAVRMVLATYSPEERLSLNIIDPACGTGGFLRAALLEMRGTIEKQELAKWRGDREKAEGHVAERLRGLCDLRLHGIDKLAELVRAAQMNLAMHGDGSTNVVQENSLVPPGEWRAETRRSIDLGKFDVVFANPPFGSKLSVDDPHILDQFELDTYGAKAPRTSVPPEQLFVERCLDFLKAGGRMAIVLPDSILSNPGLTWLRDWLLTNAYVLASVDLPKETFAKSKTGTLTSVLVLQKFSETEKRRAREASELPAYRSFMAIAEFVGWDNRGEPVLVRTPEGAEIMAKVERESWERQADGTVVQVVRATEGPLVNDQLDAIVGAFTEWVQKEGRHPWQ